MRASVYVLIILLISGCNSCTPDPIEHEVRVTVLEDYELEEVSSEWYGLYMVDPIEEDQFVDYAITNRDGSLTIRYAEKSEGSSLSLRNIEGEEVYRNIPLNEDVSRIIFENNFLSFNVRVLNIQEDQIGDTLLFSSGSDDLIGEHLKIPSLAGGEGFQDTILAAYYILDQTGEIDLGEYLFRSGAVYSTFIPDTSKKFNSGFAWGLGKWDFLSSFHSGKYHNGVQFPDYYHRLQVRVEAYPAVNELDIYLE